jgi:hypothetical protein
MYIEQGLRAKSAAATPQDSTYTVKRAKNEWMEKKQIVLFRGIAIPS